MADKVLSRDKYLDLVEEKKLIEYSQAMALLDLEKGVSKPALACLIPTAKADAVVLDVGANVEATSEMLVQFARLGSIFSRTYQKVEAPRVALLNIGEESIKGTEVHKEAYRTLKEASELDFVGNKEPYDVFTGEADVFVTNGFSGNLFVKTSEAASRYILSSVHKMHSDLQFPDITHEGFGAVVLGIKQCVIKCHGQASSAAIQGAIRFAVQYIH